MPRGAKRRLRIAAGLVLLALFGAAAWRTTLLFRQFQCDQDLIRAVRATDPAGVQAALAAGADPNVRDSGERQRSILRQLLSLFRRSGASGSAGVPGTLLLERAGLRNSPDPHVGAVMLSLIRAGARLDPRHADEVLWSATSCGHTRVVAELLNRHLITLWHSEPNLLLEFSLDPRAGVDMTRFWLAHGADPSARYPGGRTPIMYAARAGQAEKIQVLLDAGADVNAKDLNGMRAIMFAINFRQAGAVRTLLAHGAKTKYYNNDGTTTLQMAQRANDFEIVQRITAARAKER